MDLLTLRRVLAWTLVINIAFLLIWFVITLAAHDGIRDMQTRWFGISGSQFDVLNFSGIALYKMGIWLFNIAPYLALRIVASKSSGD